MSMLNADPPRLKILLVDDETANLDLLERALSRDGHQCFREISGEGALQRFHEASPNLVFMDVMLPGIDGFETVRRIRRQHATPWVPIIFLSALSTPVDIVAGLDSGGDDYMTKPIDFAVLRAKVEASQRLAVLHRQLRDKTQQLQRYFNDSEVEKRLASDLMLRLRRESRPPIPGVSLSTTPAIDFAGDIIAAEEAPDGRLHLMLADAIGHGLVAAMNVLPAVETFYQMTAQGYYLPSIIARINDTLREMIPGHRFVSALFASLDASHCTIEIWNAGIPQAWLVDSDGQVLRRFGHHLLPLGITHMDAGQMESEIETMVQGQMLVACSDGLTEAASATGTAFGETGLAAALPQAVRQEDGCQAILRALRAHVGDAAFADDVSICIARQGKPQKLIGRYRGIGKSADDFDGNIGFSLLYGAGQLRRNEVTPRFMQLAKRHFALSPQTFNRIYRVLQQLVANAIDWGLLRLPQTFRSLPPAVQKQTRTDALAKLDSGELRLSIRECRNPAGECAWEIVVDDSGPGFDGSAALEHAVASHPTPGGLALVADETFDLRFESRGNRIVAWIPE